MENGTPSYKEYMIPKRKGFRKIVAPNASLLKIQRALLKKIEKEFNKFADSENITQHFQGFLTGKSPVTAAKMHIGQETFIQMDIKDFFDSVTKDHMPININALKSKYLWHEKGYAAQGFATSPMLANFALIGFVKNLKQYLEKLPSCKAKFHIYADDITISLNVINYKLQTQIIEKVTELLAGYKFQVKPSKTRTRYTKHGYVRILGVNVGKNDIRVPRKTNRKLRAAKHAGNNHSQGGLTAWKNHVEKI